ncbi:glycosyltransferase family 4 protein [unidentified bacterial endosymbiont]|uniref:glycosyltransferase family 4 protein n=1 Tax=unidentified bacterial endosymbiont TaxID=2355 RepID=UPI00209F559A|nr:glycosyltransferase [unidentified bacterial endosymbiont]
MTTPHSILLFADRLPPLIGGMEMHAAAFIDYFTDHQHFPLSAVITKNDNEQDCIVLKENKYPIDIKNLPEKITPDFIFFNSGRWIEELEKIRALFPRARFFYRTGGNEILKASLTHDLILDHKLRQSYWIKTLNQVIDTLITNSVYTERRLLKVGITCPFLRCVGGVTISALKPVASNSQRPLTIFCAARFVPYKNHDLLLFIIHQLLLRGNQFCVRLAGDGLLLEQAKEQVLSNHLTPVIEFLGVLDNRETCHEIACADVYMQLSSDLLTAVPGGSYIHSEGMGRSILEAITAGTFVIAGRSGALPEIITEARGILVELDNLKHLIERIEAVLCHLPPRGDFIEDFSWEKIFKRYEGLFERSHENIIDHRKM